MALRRDLAEVVGLALVQGDHAEVQGRERPAEIGEHDAGEVRADVAPAARRHPKQQEPRATPDLQHVARPEALDAANRVVDPGLHLRGRDRGPRGVAVPPRDVEGRVDGLDARRVGVFEEGLPTRDLLPAEHRRSARARRRRALLRDDVRHELVPDVLRRPRDDDRLTHERVARDRGLDRAELHTEPADLHLLVHALEEHELAVGEAPDPIPCLEEAALWIGAEGVFDEALRGLLGLIQVPSRDPGAADVELTGDRGRDRLSPGVQDVDVDVG